jgi:hypothetical protein
VKGFLRLGLWPRGVHCRHNAVTGCRMDGRFEGRMVGIIAILLADSRIVCMKQPSVFPGMGMRVRRLGGLLPVVVASRANSSTLLPVARGKPGGSYRITAVVVSIRPVLKHGPRSLTCMRVAQSCPGLWGVMKVSGVMSVGSLPQIATPGR